MGVCHSDRGEAERRDLAASVTARFFKIIKYNKNKDLAKPENTSFKPTCKESQKQREIDTSKIPPDLDEILIIWPKLPDYIKAVINVTIQVYAKGVDIL